MYKKILTTEEVKEILSKFSDDAINNLYIFCVFGPGSHQIIAKRAEWLSYKELVAALYDESTVFLEIKEE